MKAVGNGGGITLNVGPKADGQIPPLQQERLLQLGDWLKVNGEAIYGSRAWEKTGEEMEVKLSRIDDNIDFNWVRNTPMKSIKEDHFSVEWTGNISPSETDSYLFDGKADDEMQVFVGRELVFDSNSKETQKSIKLKKGTSYPIKVVFREKDLQASIQLKWSGKNNPSVVIPPTVLSHDGKAGLMGQYSSLKQYMAYTTKDGFLYAIVLEWPDKSVTIPMNKPADGSNIYLLGYDKALPWIYQNEKVVIDTREIGINNIPSDYAWTFKVKLD